MGTKYKENITSLTYDLNYKWANTLLKKKDYKGAASKVKYAIRAKNTGEAADLKKKIEKKKKESDERKKESEKRKKESEFAESLKKWLEEIDSLIKKKKYVAAYDMIQSVLSKTKDKKQIKQLNDKEALLKDKLAGLYEKAVKYYKQEKFKEVIELLKIVVHIDANYEQAKDYLEKAESRQKLLDSY